jgi:hypothetical protein
MADKYDASNEQGKIFGRGNPTKVYAGSYAANGVDGVDTIVIPGINTLISCVATNEDAATPAAVTVSGTTPTITVGVTDVVQVIILYN